jgi:hypothetical protein
MKSIKNRCRLLCLCPNGNIRSNSINMQTPTPGVSGSWQIKSNNLGEDNSFTDKKRGVIDKWMN